MKCDTILTQNKTKKAKKATIERLKKAKFEDDKYKKRF